MLVASFIGISSIELRSAIATAVNPAALGSIPATAARSPPIALSGSPFARTKKTMFCPCKYHCRNGT
jgi:hypothetical protein